jgi:gluconokinase
VKPLVVVMGVSGSGKSTVGAGVAELLAVPFAEADDFHPPANAASMAEGVPLTDEDREPWLDRIAEWLTRHQDAGGVIACSALARRYRDRLQRAAPGVFFLHLDGSAELIAERLRARRGHFMPVSLLRSQLDTLEELEPYERGAVVGIDGTPDEVSARALAALP